MLDIYTVWITYWIFDHSSVHQSDEFDDEQLERDRHHQSHIFFRGELGEVGNYDSATWLELQTRTVHL